MTYGATKKEWNHFDLILGLSTELLPVVSNVTATISPKSKMKGIGKTPSVYDRSNEVVGISGWTQGVSTDADIKRWSSNQDYGICLRTRYNQAIDVDITDPDLVEDIKHLINKHLGVLPTRHRETARFLNLISIDAPMIKRIIKTPHGDIEFLADGQQCIVAGTHTSGVRYQWLNGLPNEIPTIPLEAFEALWEDLKQFEIVKPPRELATLTKDPESIEGIKYILSRIDSYEYDTWVKVGMALYSMGGGSPEWFSIFDEWSQTSNYDAQECSDKWDSFYNTRGEVGIGTLLFLAGLGRSEVAEDSEFEDLTEHVPSRFTWQTGGEFSSGTPSSWLIKNVLPKAELGVLYGASGSGKSFKMLSMAMAIVLGKEWRGHRVTQGRVAYLAAEGASGFKNRVKAYSNEFGTDINHPNLLISKDQVNFLEKRDAESFAASLVAYQPDLVIIDTFARVIPGGNENSGEDIGRALAHCQLVHHATNAMVVLVHHSGKDASKGARGWSGLRAAADWEAEVIRSEDNRAMSITKQKDGEEGQDYGFKLKIVVLGTDLDGDPITSCVIEHAEVNSSVKHNLGKIEQLVLRMCIPDLDGENPDVNTVKERAISEVPYDGNGRDRRKDLINQAYKKLKDRELIDDSDGKVVRI